MRKTVLLHSTGTAPFMWDSVPEAVVPSAQRVQPANLGYPPYELVPRGRKTTLAQEAAHVLSQLPAEGELDLVAHSYGGLVALELLPALKDRVRSLIFFEPVLFGALLKDTTADAATLERARGFMSNPWFLTDDARGGTGEWLELFIDYWNRPGSWARMPELMKHHNLQVGWKMYQEVRSVFFDNQRFDAFALPGVKLTLGMGERSPVASREMVRQLARVNPHATVFELPGTGHLAPVTHAAKVHEAMRTHSRSP
jgi:pimeloyl-ACP methyl ester carboxylesterase